MPQAVVPRPFEELELTDEDRLQPLAFCHFGFGEALAHRPPLASGRFTNGQYAVSKPRHDRVSPTRFERGHAARETAAFLLQRWWGHFRDAGRIGQRGRTSIAGRSTQLPGSGD